MEDLILAVIAFALQLAGWIARSEYAPWVAATLTAATTLGYEGHAGAGWWRTLWKACIVGIASWGVVWGVQAIVALAEW